MSRSHLIAQRYAGALFLKAGPSGELEAVLHSLMSLVNAMNTHSQLKEALSNPLYRGQSVSILLAIADKLAAPVVLKNFIQLLADNRRLNELPQIYEALTMLREKSLRILRGVIESAATLESGLGSQIAQEFSRVLQQDVRLECVVTPALLGGLVVTIGDRVWDGSVKTQLSKLEAELRRA